MSEIRANTISDAAGTGPVTLTGQSAAKTFAYFDQSTLTLGASLNVSSTTDSATGVFALNFSSAYAAYTDRAITGCAIESAARVLFLSGPDDASTTACLMYTTDAAATGYDANRSGVAIHGDLA